jgi:hypothetical protein
MNKHNTKPKKERRADRSQRAGVLEPLTAANNSEPQPVQPPHLGDVLRVLARFMLSFDLVFRRKSGSAYRLGKGGDYHIDRHSRKTLVAAYCALVKAARLHSPERHLTDDQRAAIAADLLLPKLEAEARRRQAVRRRQP